MKKKTSRKPLLVFFIFTSGILLIFALKVKNNLENKAVVVEAIREEKQSKEIPVRVKRTEKIDYQDVIQGITGKIDVPKSRLSFEIGGRVYLVGVEKGSAVSKGEILAELDKTELLLKKKYKENAHKGALIELQKAERVLAQNKEKASTGFILESKLKDYELDVNLKKNKVEAARLELEASEVNLAKTEIRAPFDGIIMDRKIEVGEYVSPNQESFVLLNVKRTYADLEINEKKLAFVKPGQSISLTTNIYKEPIQGKIESIVPALQGKAMVVSARAKIQAADNPLIPGMFVLGEIVSFTRNNAIVLPLKSLSRENNQAYVFVLREKDSKVIKKAVKVDYLNRKDAVVASGISAGEKIVVESARELKDGDLVRAEEL